MQPSTKRDALRTQWEERIRQQQTSGLSVKAFCNREHLRLATFYWWKKRLAEVDAERTSVFVELLTKKDEHVQRNKITLHCEGMCRIEIEEGTSPLYIASLVKALMEVR